MTTARMTASRVESQVSSQATSKSSSQVESQASSQVVLQVADALADGEIPTLGEVRSWATAALRAARRTGARGDGELTVRVVDRAEMADLNQRYRDRRGATNVLSFRFDADAHAPLKILGDVVICAPVVTAQAKSQRIAPTRHWAHMVIHGALHLCGFDHQTEPEATRMETLERDLLDGFGL